MTSLILSVGEKVLILFLMIGAGVILTQKNILTKAGASQLADIVLLVSTPCIIINAFSAGMDQVSVKNLLIIAAAAVAAQALEILGSRLFFRKQPPERRKVLQFGAAYANVGFMGLPLLQSLLGNDGVVYASLYIVVFNLFCWTHGVRQMSGPGNAADAPPLWKCLINPGTVGLLLGLPIFLFRLPVPGLVSEVLSGFAGLNTPLAMLCIGVHISAISFRDVLRDRSILAVTAVRLVVIPLAVSAVLRPFIGDYGVFASVVLQAAMPVGANTVLFASRYHGDEKLASQAIALSTVLSILTLPLFAVAARFVTQ